jgi:Zn-dependent protease with chaperone function
VTSLMLAGAVTVVAGCALGALGSLTRGSPGVLSPRGRARWAAACLAGAVVLTCSGLALLSGPAVFGLLPSQVLGGWRLTGGGAVLAIAWPAVCLLLSFAAMAGAGAWRARRELRVLRVEGSVGAHEPAGGFELVRLPGPAMVAYSIGGSRPQVVLSEGLCARLGADALAAVVAHEVAHLRSRHGRWLLLVSLAEAALWFAPGVGRTAGALRLAVEQWADQDAIGTAGTRALRAALLGAAGLEPKSAGVAALSDADMLAERLAMLTGEPPRGEGGVRLPGVASLAAVAGSAAAGAGSLGAAMVMLVHLCA